MKRYMLWGLVTAFLSVKGCQPDRGREEKERKAEAFDLRVTAEQPVDQFWKLLQDYWQRVRDGEGRKKALDEMDLLVTKESRIVYEKRCCAIGEFSPRGCGILESVVFSMTFDSGKEQERAFLGKLARLSNHQQLLAGLLCAIRKTDTGAVQILIREGTDVTKEPCVLSECVSVCKRQHGRGFNQDNLHAIINLLFTAGADCSGVDYMICKGDLVASDCGVCGHILLRASGLRVDYDCKRRV